MNNRNKMPYFYNSVWFYLFNLIKEYGLEEGYNKMINEFEIKTKNSSSYLEVCNAYVNDINKLELTVNPDYFNFVNMESLNDYERKVVVILAASMDLRINKPIFELIYERISLENNIKGKYSNIISKYILKYIITKNRDYVLKNLISELFGEHIFYKNLYDNELLIYTSFLKEKEKNKAINYIKNIFLKEGEKLKVFWGKHFIVLGHSSVAELDDCVAF